MHAITLHQPWASLIALGIKTVETRSWPAPARLVGRTIAIHAGKRVGQRAGRRYRAGVTDPSGRGLEQAYPRPARCWPPPSWPEWPVWGTSTR